MKRFHWRRPTHRKPSCVNAGFGCGALAALLFVVVKTLKFSDGGGRQDLPWAILIILAAGLICGFLWQLGRALFEPVKRQQGDDRPLKTGASKDKSRS